MSNNKRNTNIETLRVLSMIGIVILHYIYHGIKSQKTIVIYDGSLESFLDYSLIELLYLLTSVSVNCYVLISGYFLINKTNYRFKQLFKLWFQVLFYSVGIGILFNLDNFELNNIASYFRPIMTNQYWFITSYVGLMLLSPFISTLGTKITKGQYITLIIILSVLTLKPFYGEVYGNFDSILYFILLYIVGGYFKLFKIPQIIVYNISKLILITILLFYSLVTLINIYNYNINTINFELKSTAYNDGIFVLSILIFILFISIQKEKKIYTYISKLAPYTLGVYLIHDNSIIRNVLWGNIIPENYKTYIVIHCLISAILIFIICISIDFIRFQIFRILKINSIIDSTYNYIEYHINKINTYVKTKKSRNN